MAQLVHSLTVSLIELGESFQTNLKAMDMDERSTVLMACNIFNFYIGHPIVLYKLQNTY
jgi:hypothetical protein